MSEIQLGLPGIRGDEDVSQDDGREALDALMAVMSDTHSLAVAMEQMAYVELCAMGEAFGRLNTVVARLIAARAAEGSTE